MTPGRNSAVSRLRGRVTGLGRRTVAARGGIDGEMIDGRADAGTPGDQQGGENGDEIRLETIVHSHDDDDGQDDDERQSATHSYQYRPAQYWTRLVSWAK